MAFIDWESLEWYQWVAVGGAALLALALVVYFVGSARPVKLSAVVMVSLASLAVGFGVGMLTMIYFGYQMDPDNKINRSAPPAMGAPGGAGPPGARRPNPKVVLANLIVKLDQLTGEPLAIKLTEAQKSMVRAQARDLLDKNTSLTDAKAEKKLAALLRAFEENKNALTAAGFRWPGENPSGPPMVPPNPLLMIPTNTRHLQSLLARVGDEMGE
jgi:hypothetical protein